MGLLINTICTPAEAKWCALFLDSLFCHHPDAKAAVSGPVAAQSVERARRTRAGRVDFADQSVPSPERGIDATVRGIKRTAAIARDAECHLVVHAAPTTIVRASLSDLETAMGLYDLGVVMHERVDGTAPVADGYVSSSFLVAKRAAADFLAGWADRLAGRFSDATCHAVERAALHETLIECDLRVLSLPASRYCVRPPFRSDAEIWSADLSSGVMTAAFHAFHRDFDNRFPVGQ